MAVACWYACRRVSQEPVIVFENSDRYPKEVAVQLLGDIYIVMPHVCVSTRFGALSYRSRMWIVMAHREFCVRIWASLQNIIPLFHRILEVSWRCILDERETVGASAEEQSYELEWAKRRPTSGIEDPSCSRTRVGPWEESLTKTEHSYLAGYEEKEHFVHGCAMHMHQNPKTHPQFSKDHLYLMCLISSQNVIFCSCPSAGGAGTWLCPSETFTVLGFPTQIALSNGVRCCSLAPRSGSRMLQDDSRESMEGPKGDFAPYTTRRPSLLHMSGNSMDVSVCGAHWLYILTFIHRLDQELL